MEIIALVFVVLFVLGLSLYGIELSKFIRRAHKEKAINEKDTKSIAVRITIISLFTGLFTSFFVIMVSLSSRLNTTPDIPIYLSNIFTILFCTFSIMLIFLLTFVSQVIILKSLYIDRPK